VHWLTKDSLGGALTDTLDNLITERRIEPQLAMKILLNFDKAVADVLTDKVKARTSFKVRFPATNRRRGRMTDAGS
jgi:hypothetical protein